MSPKKHVIILLLFLLFHPRVSSHPAHVTGDSDATETLEVLMPGVAPQSETNLCTSIRLNKTVDIVGYEPRAKMTTVHHILVYGCLRPGSEDGLWECGEMGHNHGNDDHHQHHPDLGVCSEGEGGTILYAWAMDAPKLLLPPGVGFKVGPDTKVKFIVMQVHYGNVTSFLPPNNNVDHSGVAFLTKSKSQPKQAGIYLMVTGGIVPSFSTAHLEAACPFKGHVTIHPFAFRTHTHTHGKVVSGYRVRGDQWTEIGRKNPQLPQMFYNVTNHGITIEPGDYLASRCTMVNEEKEDIQIGNTSEDEMCNFYFMYYVDGNTSLEQNICATSGHPYFRWTMYFRPSTAGNIPGDASLVPGTNTIFEESGANYGEYDQNVLPVVENDDEDDDDDNDDDDGPYVNWKKNLKRIIEVEKNEGFDDYLYPVRDGYYVDRDQEQKLLKDLKDQYQD